jgi:hypothetical protein
MCKNVKHYINGYLLKILGINGYGNEIDKINKKIDNIKSKNDII